MTTATILSWVLAAVPVPPTDTPDAAPVVEADEYTTPAGHRTRWASAKYVLPDGKLAEVFIIADDTASGEATISVDGEAVASSSFDERGVTHWVSSVPGTSERAAAAVRAIGDRGGNELLDAFIPEAPQEFPCSDYGKKVVGVAKHIWGGMMVAAGAACCYSSGLLACVGCAVAADKAKDFSYEGFENYCD